MTSSTLTCPSINRLYLNQFRMTENPTGQASIRYTPSEVMVAGGRLELGSNILAKELVGWEVRVARLVSNIVPPTFSFNQSVIASFAPLTSFSNCLESSSKPSCLAAIMTSFLSISGGMANVPYLNQLRMC